MAWEVLEKNRDLNTLAGWWSATEVTASNFPTLI